MTQDLFFGTELAETTKPAGDRWVSMRILITVKAAPQPSSTYGETVCVAGLRLDLGDTGWVRLFPINFRELDQDQQFRKYQIVRLRAKPARPDPRVESWRPDLTSIQPEAFLRPWVPRRQFVDPYVTDSMCDILEAVPDRPPARSMAAVRPREVTDVEIAAHPGWTRDEQAKIDRYANQPDLRGGDRSVLEAPAFKGWYVYRCGNHRCPGHRQGILDWEFVALQRRLKGSSDMAIRRRLRERFLDKICGPDRDVAFYVGNQAKRPQVFGVVGVYYPKR